MLIKQKQQRQNIRACGLGPQGINAALCTNTWLETNGNNSQLSHPCLKYYQEIIYAHKQLHLQAKWEGCDRFRGAKASRWEERSCFRVGESESQNKLETLHKS